MNKKVVFIIASVLVLVSVGVYILQNRDRGANVNLQPTGKPLRVAIYNWPGTFWVEIAHKNGWFAQEGLTVELIDTNADYYASLQQVVDGEIDANNFPFFDFVSYNMNGADLVAVTISDVSSGIDGLVAVSDVQEVADLAGKRVGVTAGTYSEYFLDTLLKWNGMTIGDVIMVEVDAENTVSALENGLADAVVSWEPLMSEAVVKLGANIIFDSSEIDGINGGLWVFSRDFVNERPGDVQAFVRVWARTADYIRENPDEAFLYIAEVYGGNVDDVKAYAALDQILTPDEAKKRLSNSLGFNSVYGVLRRMESFISPSGSVVDSSIINEMLVKDFIENL